MSHDVLGRAERERPHSDSGDHTRFCFRGRVNVAKKNERKPRDRILKYFKFHLCPNKLKYKFCISFSTQFHFLVLF